MSILFERYCKQIGLSFEKEVLFAANLGRKWRSDYVFYFYSCKIAVEIEGGGWTGGRHTTGKGFEGDMQKYNAYTALGYKLLRFSPTQIEKDFVRIAKFIKDIGVGNENIDTSILQIANKKVGKSPKR